MRAHLEWLAAPARPSDPTRYPEPLIEIAFDHGGDGDPNRAQLFDITPAGLDAAADLAAGVNGDDPYCRCNVYVGVCLKKPNTPRGHRTNGGHSCIITAMPVDIDHDAEESNAKLDAIATAGLTVTTGTVPELRQQKWCALAKPCADMPLVKHAFEAVVEHIDGDTNATGLNRLMRLAGSVSRPCPKKQARGYVPELTTLVIDPNAPPADIAVFAALAPRDQPREPREPRSPRPDSPNGTADEVARLGLSPKDLRVLVMDIPNDGGDDNSPDYADWLRVGGGIHHETMGSQAGFELFDEWSAKHPSYDGKKTLKTYESFDKAYSGQRATAATIVYIARQTGSNWYPLDPIDEGVATPEAKPVEAETPIPNHEPEPVNSPKPEPEQAAVPEPPPIGEARDTKQEQEQPKAQSNKPSGATPPTSVFDPWDKFAAPAFPLDVLNDELRDFVTTMATAIGCDPSAIAMGMLGVFSGAITHELKLQMNREDTSFLVSACLWVLLVGDPSTMKSPLLKVLTQALFQHQSEQFKEYKKHKRKWDEADKATRGPEPLEPPRHVVTDTSYEKLCEILSRSPRGLLTFHDELAGWLGSMDRYSDKGVGRTVWLRARDGGPHFVDRIGRPSDHVENLSSSLLGGIQPERLAKIEGLTDDGLLQRFVPVMMERSRRARDIPTTEAIRKYEDRVRACLSVPATTVRMSDEAYQVMRELRDFLHDLGNASAGVSAGFQSFVGKLVDVAGNLALILHIIDDPFSNPFKVVPVEIARKASRLIHEFVLPHGLELYQSAGGGEARERGRKIASYVLTSGKTEFTASDFTRNVWPLVGMSMFDLMRAVSPLVAWGWLDLDSRHPNAPRWKSRPGVAEAMAERRETEERESQALSNAMGWKRRPHKWN
jgi:hypothetical protein